MFVMFLNVEFTLQSHKLENAGRGLVTLLLKSLTLMEKDASVFLSPIKDNLGEVNVGIYGVGEEEQDLTDFFKQSWR